MKKSFWLAAYLSQYAVILWFWWQRSESLITDGNAALALGRLAGLLGAYLILVQLLLIGRIKPLEQAFGHDRLSRIHHVHAFAALGLLLLHPLLLNIAYRSFTGFNPIEQIQAFINNFEDVFQAVIALNLFALVVIASLVIVRKHLKYQWWYAVHLLTYLAILLAFGHQIASGGDFIGNSTFVFYWQGLYGIVGLLFVTFRFVLPVVSFARHRFTVTEIIQENPQTVSVVISGEQLERFHYRGGQFVLVRFLDTKRWWEAHPFSLSRQMDGRYLRLTIKASGDFTRELKHLQTGTPVLIEGPLGVFTARQSKYPNVLCIAGGVGITPIRAMLPELLAARKNVTFVHAIRTPADQLFVNELTALTGTSFRFKTLCEQAGESSGLRQGRVTRDALEDWIHDGKTIDVYLCGPPRMMKAVRQLLARLGVPRGRVHFERFSL